MKHDTIPSTLEKRLHSYSLMANVLDNKHLLGLPLAAGAVFGFANDALTQDTIVEHTVNVTLSGSDASFGIDFNDAAPPRVYTLDDTFHIRPPVWVQVGHG